MSASWNVGNGFKNWIKSKGHVSNNSCVIRLYRPREFISLKVKTTTKMNPIANSYYVM